MSAPPVPVPSPSRAGSTAPPPPAPPPPLEVQRWTPSRAGRTARLAVLAGLLAAVLLVPAVVPGVYIPVVARAAVYGIVALSMNLLVGYAGQVSLGHAAFFGVGAFAAGYTLTELDLPWLMGTAVAAATGALAAVALGAVALRVKGLYLALVTIAYGLFAQEVVFNFGPLTGGGAGQAAPRPVLFSSDLAYAYLCLAALGVALGLDWVLTRSKPGRAITALRDDERVAASWGIDVTRYKLLAFVLSGGLAAVAGGMFASIEQIVAPADFQFGLSLTFLLMTVVGGAGNRWGVVQGGIIFAILPTLLDAAHTNIHVWPFTAIDARWEGVIASLLLLLTLTLFPGGIAQQQHHLLRWLSFDRFRSQGSDPLVDPPVLTRGGRPVDPEAVPT